MQAGLQVIVKFVDDIFDSNGFIVNIAQVLLLLFRGNFFGSYQTFRVSHDRRKRRFNIVGNGGNQPPL